MEVMLKFRLPQLILQKAIFYTPEKPHAGRQLLLYFFCPFTGRILRGAYWPPVDPRSKAMGILSAFQLIFGCIKYSLSFTCTVIRLRSDRKRILPEAQL